MGEQQQVQPMQEKKSNKMIIVIIVFIVLIGASAGVYFFTQSDDENINTNTDTVTNITNTVDTSNPIVTDITFVQLHVEDELPHRYLLAVKGTMNDQPIDTTFKYHWAANCGYFKYPEGVTDPFHQTAEWWYDEDGGCDHGKISVSAEEMVTGLKSKEFVKIPFIEGDNIVAPEDTNTNEDLNVNSSSVNTNLNTVVHTNTNLVAFGSEGDVRRIEWTRNKDEDKDNLYESYENIWGTSDNLIDTDGDGFTDLEEIEGCYNPITAGVMTDEYFTDVYCDGKWRFTFSNDEDIEDDQFSLLMNDASTLCEVYKVASNFSVRHEHEGDAVYSVDRDWSYDDLCEKTADVMASTELNSYINAFLIESGNHIDMEEPFDVLCDMMGEIVDLFCGENWGFN